MDGLSIALLVLLYVLLTLFLSMRPLQGTLSDYEKNRLLKKKMSGYKLDSQRDKHYAAALGVRYFKIAFLVFFIALLLVSQMYWLWAFIIFLIGAIIQLLIVGSGVVQRAADKLYYLVEPYLFWLLEKYPLIVKIASRPPLPSQKPRQIYSKEEMIHLATESKGVLTAKEIKRISKTLSFSDRLVDSVMTPRSVVEVVKSSDLLGPLRLDELHKTGYSRFPVVGKDIDDVIGVVYIRNLLELVDKDSKRAKDLMDSPVHYIKKSQTLEHALGAFLRTRHHLFVVVNEFRETVGVITLEDVVEELIGERILDQFDQHDDLRVVAARNLKGNNTTKKSLDV